MRAADGGVDFARTPRRLCRNEYWVCPPALRADADEPSPEFDVPVERLEPALDAVLAGEPRLSELARSPDGRRRVLEQRTATLGLPDRITVEFVDLGRGRSTLALHSAARYGFVDLGVNRARLRRWLAGLRRRLGRPDGLGNAQVDG